MLTATDVTAETISVSVKTSTSTQAAVTKTSTFALYPVLNAADISVPLDGAPSDAASLNTLKVIVRDLKGNPVGGQTVNWSMNSPSGKALFSPSAGITAVSTSNSSGEAVINLTDRRMENVTVTAKVAGGLPEQTQSKDTRFMQYVALTITGLTNNNCAVTCAITVNVNAKDIDGNPLVNLKVGSHSAAYGGGSSGFTLSSTDASGNVAVLRPMTVAAVDTGVYAFADSFSNPGVISATRSGNVSEYRSASTTVVTTSPALYTGNLAANITAHCSGPVVDIYITTTGGVFPAGG
ncbi:Bacterial Ig-like domain (group 1) [Citrobacter freundii]|nr:Bacterial Ig-like domain (group 1) [Citrobacter freundii]